MKYIPARRILKKDLKFLDNIKRDLKDKAEAQIKANFEEEKQNAPGFGLTYRRNKTVVEGSKRDAVDLGNLLEGLTYEWRGNTLWVMSGETYFEYVIEGFVSSSGKTVPNRRDLLRVFVN
jgi:hypothetical protein